MRHQVSHRGTLRETLRLHLGASLTSTPPNASPTGPRRLWQAVRARWYGRWAIDLAIIGLVVWAVGRYQARALLDDATPAPSLELTDLAGRHHRLADLRGQKVLVHFFAPWCGVCRFESDNWDRVQTSNPDLRVLAVALGWTERREVEDFFGASPPNHPVLLGTDADQSAWRVSVFPTHYLLDEEGRVVWQAAGYTPTVGFWLRLL